MSVDYRKFKFNSRMPMDNVIFAHEATVQNIVPSGYSAFDFSIDHELGFAPLAFGIFSTNNGESWRDIDFRIGNANDGSTFTDDEKIYANILLEQYFSSIKIRLFAFQPSDTIASVTPPQPLSQFYLNTNNSYDNLIATGVYQLQNNLDEQVIYEHNLGYIPRVMLWADDLGALGRISQANAIPADDDYNYPIITTSQLKYRFNDTWTYSNPIVHYRLYGRQNG